MTTGWITVLMVAGVLVFLGVLMFCLSGALFGDGGRQRVILLTVAAAQIVLIMWVAAYAIDRAETPKPACATTEER